MLNKYSCYPFKTDMVSIEEMLSDLESFWQKDTITRVSYPPLNTDYTHGGKLSGDSVKAALEKASGLIDLLLHGLIEVPPILLKSPHELLPGVENTWIIWGFREFAAGHFPVSRTVDLIPNTVLSGELDSGLVRNVLWTQVRRVYFYPEFFEYKDHAYLEEIQEYKCKQWEQRIKNAFNVAFYGG